MLYYKLIQILSNFVLTEIKNSLEEMKASFKSDAKSVIDSSKNLDIALTELKNDKVDSMILKAIKKAYKKSKNILKK